ncbi:MAG: hypothetical protein HOD63_01405 [Bacteroidetes bacterium]|nr:hypothetical protein [Bacteroidota bacterium]MBT3932847.1 hypothetical protein [Bacteroidota bacterium]MBT4337224.1 hypothetical protein [Bacteroidota bacterium]MBT4728443.1 hypothetical protein [Bacteroidota bacterium]MBT6835514.1 hypothetical protein [Bacteroidota bacterium]
MTKTNKNAISLLQPKQIQDTDDLKRRAMTIGFYGLAGFLGYKFLLQPQIQKYKQRKEQNDVVFNDNKRQATVLFNAMNPSGIKWMQAFDTTNEEMVYDAARRITNWNEVQTTYRNLYSKDLLNDLQNELTTKEFNTFFSLLNTNSSSSSNGSSTGKAYTKKGMLIVASANIRLRTTPDSTISAYSLNTNVLGVAKTNTFLGWATGQQQIDNDGVKYLEVRIKFSTLVPSNVFSKLYSKLKNKTMTFWVGLGAIKQYSYYSQLTSAGIKLYAGVKDSGLRTNFN